jgi:hypothetical protein
VPAALRHRSAREQERREQQRHDVEALIDGEENAAVVGSGVLDAAYIGS